MRKYILLLLICLALQGHTAVSFEQAKVVYKRILITNKITFAPGLRYNPSPYINASCGLFSISINAGMLKSLNNDSELALILGHELAHHTLRHFGSTPDREFAADALGARYSSNAGYDVCRGANFFKRHNRSASTTHPGSIERYKRLCN